MKLAAIYNVWDGIELLEGSINCIKDDVDFIIIVSQSISNFGERYNPLREIIQAIKNIDREKIIILDFTPNKIAGQSNEIQKRNLGLQIAKEFNCTHFLHLDTDEYYQNFRDAKNLYIESGTEGSACRIFTYFKLPTLRFETEDGYYVPFIHKLLPETQAGGDYYPYYVDRTRRINCKEVALLPIHMHHFSWVRNNIERKFRNSSAKNNLERGTMLIDYNNPNVKEGFYVTDYDKKLIEVPNYFNIQ